MLCIFLKNQATFYGGGSIGLLNAKVLVCGSKFVGNRANYGAAIFAHSSMVKITECSTSWKMDALNCPYKNSSLVSGCIFHNNTALSSYGAFYAFNSSVNIYCSNFSHNFGGGVGATSDSSMYIFNCYFLNNMATLGAAIFSESVNISITNSEFLGNVAHITDSEDFNSEGFGGAVSLLNCNSIINNNKFITNSAQYSGGAVYCEQNTIMVITGNEFISNSADIGGAISADAGDITGNNFANNTARSYGGATAVREGWSNISGTFYNNAAINGGAAVYAPVSYTHLTLPTIYSV